MIRGLNTTDAKNLFRSHRADNNPQKPLQKKKQEDELLGNGLMTKPKGYESPLQMGHVISLERGRCVGCAYDRILLLWKPKVGVFSRCARVNRVTCRPDIEPRNQHKLKLVGIKKERKKKKQVSNLILAAVSQSSCKFSK